MRIIVECESCGQTLSTKVFTNVLNEMVILVAPCDNKDCYNCADCEEVFAAEDAKSKIVELKEKLKALAE